eukprot:jgi/Hompol1/3552/HPOL_006609-RA
MTVPRQASLVRGSRHIINFRGSKAKKAEPLSLGLPLSVSSTASSSSSNLIDAKLREAEASFDDVRLENVIAVAPEVIELDQIFAGPATFVFFADDGRVALHGDIDEAE